MAPMEVEVTVTSAKDLKNVNWRHGDLKPYAVVWVDPNAKCSTNVDNDGDTCPVWDETLVVPVNCPVDEAILSIDIVHANAPEDTKPLIGSARIPVKEIVDEVGFGEKIHRTLQLTRPSGRPQGKLQVKIKVRDSRYRAPAPYPAPAYGVPPPSVSREYYPPPYGYSPQAPPTTVPPSGYPYSGPPPPPPVYGQPGYVPVEEKKSGLGMGTGLAVGAVAGVLGGIALSEGVEAAENHIAEEAAEKVEEDMAYEAAYEASYDDDY